MNLKKLLIFPCEHETIIKILMVIAVILLTILVQLIWPNWILFCEKPGWMPYEP